MRKQTVLDAIHVLPEELDLSSLINYLREIDKKAQTLALSGVYFISHAELVEMAAMYYK